MDYQEIIFEVKDQTAIVILNRPERLNALSPRMKQELEDVISEIEADRDIRGVILTGAGKAFSSGTDIAQFPETVEQARQVTAYAQRLFGRIAALGKPTIAAMNGMAYGGGLELALCCDLRIAARGIKMGFPEARLCAIPCYGGTQLLPRVIGEGRAKEMILTGEAVDSEKALAWGLLNEVTRPEELLPRAHARMKRILENAPLALGYAKMCIRGGLEGGEARGLELEQNLVSMLVATEDMSEGVRAFLEKRPPVFHGR